VASSTSSAAGVSAPLDHRDLEQGCPHRSRLARRGRRSREGSRCDSRERRVGSPRDRQLRLGWNRVTRSTRAACLCCPRSVCQDRGATTSGSRRTMERSPAVHGITGHRDDQPAHFSAAQRPERRGCTQPSRRRSSASSSERDRLWAACLEVTMVEGALNAAAELVSSHRVREPAGTRRQPQSARRAAGLTADATPRRGSRVSIATDETVAGVGRSPRPSRLVDDPDLATYLVAAGTMSSMPVSTPGAPSATWPSRRRVGRPRVRRGRARSPLDVRPSAASGPGSSTREIDHPIVGPIRRRRAVRFASVDRWCARRTDDGSAQPRDPGRHLGIRRSPYTGARERAGSSAIAPRASDRNGTAMAVALDDQVGHESKLVHVLSPRRARPLVARRGLLVAARPGVGDLEGNEDIRWISKQPECLEPVSHLRRRARSTYTAQANSPTTTGMPRSPSCDGRGLGPRSTSTTLGDGRMVRAHPFLRKIASQRRSLGQRAERRSTKPIRHARIRGSSSFRPDPGGTLRHLVSCDYVIRGSIPLESMDREPLMRTFRS